MRHKTESNKHEKKGIIVTDNRMVATRGGGEMGEDKECKGDQVCNNGRRLDFGW